MNKKKLSICIATYNRCEHLKSIVEEILKQISNQKLDFEVIVADGGSNDNTRNILQKLQIKYKKLKIILLGEKGGIDKDYDIAVENANGEYVWLLSDDDFIEDNTLKIINAKLSTYEPDITIINSSCWDNNIEHCLKEKMLNISEDITIKNSSYYDEFFNITQTYSSFIGCFIIKREKWIKIERKKYYGTRFIHMGILSEVPRNSKIVITSEPLIRIRLGNAEWSIIAFGIWYLLWPKIIRNFNITDQNIKKRVSLKNIRARISLMTFHRAMGNFNFKIYKNYIDKKKHI
jgi:abequosyltransferase